MEPWIQVVLPLGIALFGAVTSITIAVVGIVSRRRELAEDRQETRRQREEDRSDRSRVVRAEVLEELDSAIVDFADRVEALKLKTANLSEAEVDRLPRPDDFRVHASLHRLITRAGERQIATSAAEVIHAARMGDVRRSPQSMSPMLTVLHKWLLGELNEADTVGELVALRTEAFRRAEAEERSRQSRSA